MSSVSTKNSFRQGWLWFKESLGLLRSERRISAFVFLYAFSFFGLSLVSSIFSIVWAPIMHLGIVPLLGYFYCRLQERVVLGDPAERPLVTRLKTNLGPFLLMGFGFAVFSGLNTLAIKSLPTGGPVVQAVAVAVGALLTWILSFIMNVAVWLMAVKTRNPSDALSLGITAFFSHLRSIAGITLSIMLVMIPSVVLMLLLLGMRIISLKNPAMFAEVPVTSFIFSGLTILTSLGALLSFIALIALNVFSTFVICRDLFETAPRAALENPTALI